MPSQFCNQRLPWLSFVGHPLTFFLLSCISFISWFNLLAAATPSGRALRPDHVRCGRSRFWGEPGDDRTGLTTKETKYTKIGSHQEVERGVIWPSSFTGKSPTKSWAHVSTSVTGIRLDSALTMDSHAVTILQPETALAVIRRSSLNVFSSFVYFVYFVVQSPRCRDAFRSRSQAGSCPLRSIEVLGRARRRSDRVNHERDEIHENRITPRGRAGGHMAELIYREESYKIMGACFDVYKQMGRGFLEAVYQECLE